MRRVLSEALGTAGLLAMVVGSGIAADQLSGGNAGLALLVNAVATGAGLVVLILALGPISGAHFNPAVSLWAAWRGELSWREVPGYVAAQVGGGVVGVLVAHAMFELPLVSASAHVRAGSGQWIAEAVATIGLLLTIAGVGRARAQATPFAVGLYVLSAYWFTASTSFANPAVTLARTLTGTFAGIRGVDAPAFIAAQFAGVGGAVVLAAWLWPAPVRTPAAVPVGAEPRTAG
jgi:glycerol uptake facilitator-like aquaporin